MSSKFIYPLFIFFTFLVHHHLNAQCGGNLITNGGFEDIDACPSSFYPGDGTAAGDYMCTSFSGGQCIPWRQLTDGSVDSRNICYDPWGEIASNPPHCGNGYGSFYPYFYVSGLPDPQYCEYMFQQFTNPMIAGVTYEVSLWYRTRSFNDSMAQDLDFHISNNAIVPPPSTFYGVLSSVVPTYHYHAPPPPASGWSTWAFVSFLYTATGGEDFLSLGHFGPVTFTQTFSAYIHIDDVSVIPQFTTPTQIISSNASCGACDGSAWLNHSFGNVSWYDISGTLILANQDTISNLCPGTYTAKFNCNCIDSVIGTVVILDDTIKFNYQSASFCDGDSYTLPGGNIVTSAGVYHDTIQTTSGCDSVIVTTLTKLNKTYSSFQSNFCAGLSFTLPDGVSVTEGGTYDVVIPNAAGCDSNIHVVLTSLSFPDLVLPNDTTICEGSSIQIDANPNFVLNGVYSWNTGSNKPKITVDHSGLYIASVTYNPCPPQHDSILVNMKSCDCEIFIPNAFSPNGDYLNDIFKPKFICDQDPSNYQLTIFNRWGQKMFSTTHIEQGWDGTFQHSKQEVGTYFYLITYLNAFRRIETVYKGDITLIQ